MNVYNQDGFPSIANALLFGTTLVPLNQSTATTGFIPVIQTNGGLTLTAPSGLGITWANVLTAGNTSGATNPIISSGQSLVYAANNVRIGVGGSPASGLNGDVIIGSGTRSGGTNTPCIVIGNGTVTALNTATTATISIGGGVCSSGSGGNIAIGGALANAGQAIAIGQNALAQGGIALGSGSSCATGSGVSIAIGNTAVVSNNATSSVVIGPSTIAASPSDISIGNSAITSGASGGNRISIGSGATCGAASVQNAICIGPSTLAVNSGCVSLGNLASSAGTSSIALGPNCNAITTRDIAIGNTSITVGTAGSAQERIAIGANATAGAGSVNYSIAIGSTASSTGLSSIAIGRATSASALQSYTLGFSTSVVGNNDIAIGSAATTTTANSGRIVMGTNATASGDQGIAIGSNTTVAHNNSVAIGRNATTTAVNQIMIGNNASGGTNQVYHNVGITGITQSSGFLKSLWPVGGGLVNSGVQVIPNNSTYTNLVFGPVIYNNTDDTLPYAVAGSSGIVLRNFAYYMVTATVEGAFLGIFSDGIVVLKLVLNDNGADFTQAWSGTTMGNTDGLCACSISCIVIGGNTGVQIVRPQVRVETIIGDNYSIGNFSIRVVRIA